MKILNAMMALMNLPPSAHPLAQLICSLAPTAQSAFTTQGFATGEQIVMTFHISFPPSVTTVQLTISSGVR